MCILSVILPVYNGEKYVKSAIDSILNQSFEDFELIIINDGSNDGTLSILNSFKDKRLNVISQENKGLIYSLNYGISLAKGKYIARMDADDIADVDRFENQVYFLDHNSDYIICGSQKVQYFHDDPAEIFHQSNLPIDDIDIKTYLFFNSPFAHPSVMFRNSESLGVELKYDENFKYAEDYYLWVNLLSKGKGKNLKSSRLKYRDTPNSESDIGRSKMEERRLTLSKIKLEVCKKWNLDLDEKELSFLYELSLNSSISKMDFKVYSLSYINSFFQKFQYDATNNEGCRISKYVLGFFYLKIFLLNKNLFKKGLFSNSFNYRLAFSGLKYYFNVKF
ncbi:glycosyltransferase [Myroides odoratimimus]|uniref:Glycosyltransferase 2-like domain-containing protein n=1 Tax=Myroides odoratimimus TaxID=76832 RepID=A0AAI8C8U5_9FLAO|nr:glycosyltransferase [Myroides odoratimimus]ALU28045.1 hypothetical protein AS202_18660 [Myroides odoratimimus]